jgi:hypothetical protein
MGREATCRARFAGKSSTGKALLETQELRFRGDFRVVVPFREMTSVRADASNLTVSWTDEKVQTLVLELGAQATKWAARIRNPPSRLDKLGVKATSTVALLGGDRARTGFDLGAQLQDFVGELEARGATILEGKTSAKADLFFLPVAKRADLDKVPPLVPSLRAGAALWVLRPKGSPDVSETDVRNAARSAGLVGIKVAAFSPTLTADKFVVPKSRR